MTQKRKGETASRVRFPREWRPAGGGAARTSHHGAADVKGIAWGWRAELGRGEWAHFYREDTVSTQLTLAYVSELKGVGTRLRTATE